MTAGRNEVTPPYKITFRIIFIIVRTLTRGETMETITFTADLERNIRMMQELFRNDDTLIIRRAIGQNGLRCALFFFDGMVNSLAINQSLVRPILRCEQPRLSADILAAAVLQADECRVETDMNKVFAAFLYGDAIVLTDGDARPVLVNTKGFDKRSTAAPAYLSATGTDVTDALRNLRSILPGDLYLSHAQVLLLSEDAVSESILPLADYLCRENDVRLSLRAAVVRDGSAAELLENDNEVYALSELLDRSAQDGILPDMPLYRVTDVLHADGTAILPALRVDAFGQTAPAGTAVFKNERLNCFLDGEIGGGAYA